MRTRIPPRLFAACFAAALLLPMAVPAAVFTWTNPAGGSWDDPTNWSGSGYPQFFFDFADFGLQEVYAVDATDPARVSVIAGMQVRAGEVRLSTHDDLRAVAVIGGYGMPATVRILTGALVGSGAHSVTTDGTLILSEGARIVGNAGTGTGLRIETGGALYGNGAVEGSSLTVAGLLSPGEGPGLVGSLSLVSQSWEQFPGAILEMELGADGADHVSSAGPVILAGALHVLAVDGENPPTGDHVLVDAPQISGGFDEVALPPIPGYELTLVSEPARLILRVEAAAAAAAVELDVLPGSCRNPISVHRKGKLPVALIGGSGIDPSSIDPAALRLEGVAPTHWSWSDVTGPRDGDDACASCPSEPDGEPDLLLHIPAEDLRDALGNPARGETVTVRLEGTLADGSILLAEDCVEFVGGKKNKAGAAAADAAVLRPASRPGDRLQAIAFRFEEPTRARLDVFDVTGRRVESWGTQLWPEGEHEVRWDASTRSRGVYFYRLAGESGVWTAKQAVVH